MLRWMQEIKRFLPVKPQYILGGNINDVFPFTIQPDSAPVTLSLRDYIRGCLKTVGQYNLFVEYQPIIGFRLIEGSEESFKKITTYSISSDKPVPATLSKAAEIIERLVKSTEARCVIIMGMASHYRLLEREEVYNEFFHRMYALSQETSPKLCKDVENAFSPLFDPIFWIVERENQIPDWFSINNVRVRSICLPKPDFETRRMVVGALSKRLPGFSELTPEKQNENIGLFTDGTSGMFASEIISIVQLARNEKISFGEIGEAIKRYRVGVIENPWSKLEMKKIKNARDLLEKRVKGQSEAVAQSVDIIRRAVFNLSGAQYSRFSMRPKGVLFFAGPTGVGKTELAKSISELLFGSESSYIRYDMSEFGHEHSDQRLIGSPPGYVGYDVGGELTNAIKANPFSVVLFDEIEKAHPKILDMFLQILDDGRLTSGRGETVFFTESLIIFTSNLGIYETLPTGEKRQRVSPGMEYLNIKKEVILAIQEFFTYKINRPEILNRIGENIVIFDFIRQHVASQIFERMLENVRLKLLENNHIQIDIQPEAKKRLFEVCTKNLSMGGRGIGNNIEKLFLNPLSSQLFEIGANEKDKIKVMFSSEIGLKLEKTWNLEVKK
ncbi:MAG: ATP-dependent Clp protease ATP-binding subunit [Candidatus Riflebacteria bacterium]|nr:ATP-dependent Clp protease ATP-binding subunit [Candidatus Riflebacteria bacterium]